MQRRRLVPGLFSLLAALLPVAAPPAQAAAAPTTPVFNMLTSTALPRGFGAIEVDGATRRVFVSSPLSNVVTVLGFDAQIQGSIPVPGADAVTLDGGVIYVASTTAGRIDAFSTTTLAPVATFGGGALVRPNTLVKAAGKLWTTSGACGQGVHLVSIDTVTGALTHHPPLQNLSECPVLIASPVDPNAAFGYNEAGSGSAVVRLDLSTGAPVAADAASSPGSNLADVEVFPDGRVLGVAAGWPYEIRTMSTDPLGPFGVVYPTGAYPNAIDSTAGGGGLVAAGRDGAYDPDIDVFRLGDPSQSFLQYDFGTTSNTLKAGGLAFSPDGVRLFAVSGRWDGDTSSLTVFGPGPDGGRYHPLSPARILDTREGARVGPASTVDVQVTGQGGVPSSGVSAVAVNVTVTGPTATSYLTVFPAGNGSAPLASNLNFTPGKTVPNLVVVKVGTGGKVSMYNAVGSVDVIFDVAGWYSHPAAEPEPDGRYTPVIPSRILDTREGGARLGPGGSLDLQVAGHGGVPATGAMAAVLNVAATGTTADSFVTAYPTGQARPLASNLNFGAGETVSNRAMVKLGTGGKVTIYNLAGSTDIVVDVGGWYSDASVTAATGVFTPLAPARILDTRQGASGPVAGGTAVAVQVTGRGGVPAAGVSAVILNATVVDSVGPGFLTVFPSGGNLPLASDVNFATGEIRPNLTVVRVGTGGTIDVYASTTTHVVLDVAGWIS